MKNQVVFSLVGTVIVILGIFAINYEGRPETPVIGADGKISGYYAIEGIMRLGKPYVCTFEKTDGTSKLAGVIHTDGQKIYEQFRIKTDLIKNEFNSFLLVKDGEAYTWTSLSDLGYKSSVVKNASRSTSPAEQAQIVGTRDKLVYKCEPWQNVDNTIFEIPTWIKFTDLKN